ncbi:hypothetical protein GWK47_043878 [Chionoecetes opilio]|uniref:Uncharacterized protein n=1 Tax=Chionoecetes opilio TaxID=41210 RepID=A0A8J5CVZ6_CHIOP|nr:hypothetical protein GWK47_043878 [Chionoecetes opilio]
MVLLLEDSPASKSPSSPSKEPHHSSRNNGPGGTLPRSSSVPAPPHLYVDGSPQPMGGGGASTHRRGPRGEVGWPPTTRLVPLTYCSYRIFLGSPTRTHGSQTQIVSAPLRVGVPTWWEVSEGGGDISHFSSRKRVIAPQTKSLQPTASVSLCQGHAASAAFSACAIPPKMKLDY